MDRVREMGIAPGIKPIFKTGVFSHSDAQPAESYGKSMDFGPIFTLFRGLEHDLRSYLLK